MSDHLACTQRAIVEAWRAVGCRQRRPGAESLISARGPRPESRLRDSARLGQPCPPRPRVAGTSLRPGGPGPRRRGADRFRPRRSGGALHQAHPPRSGAAPSASSWCRRVAAARRRRARAAPLPTPPTRSRRGDGTAPDRRRFRARRSGGALHQAHPPRAGADSAVLRSIHRASHF